MKTLLNKNYTAEELCDVGRDVYEAFDPRFTPEAKGIPTDKNGFSEGVYRVTVTWHKEQSHE